jgi:hypothetical protein
MLIPVFRGIAASDAGLQGRTNSRFEDGDLASDPGRDVAQLTVAETNSFWCSHSCCAPLTV